MQSPPFGDGSTIQKQTFSKRRARRRLAIFALSAIFAGGIPLALVSSAPADSPAAQVQMSDADLLQKGMNQYDAGQYEEAVATLEKVNPKNLSDAGLTALNDALSKAELAASARVAARKEFELGEQSRQAHNPADAIKHYQAVVDNRFADEGTRQKAIEQLALAKAEAANGVASTGAQTPAESPKPEVVVVPAGQSNWSLYEQATADMNAGHFDDARAIFKQLEAAGYQPPGFNRAPADMLKEVDFRAGLSAPPRTGAQAYGDALYQYNHGNLLGARLGFEKAEQMGYQPAAGQPTPAQYLARLNPPDQTELTTPLAVAQPQVAVSSESATPAAENIPATQPTPNAEEQLKAETENQELQKERDQFRARGLVDLARQAYEENRKEEALSDYEEAANLDPTNEQAVAGVKELQEETGKTTASANIQQYTHRIAAEVEEIKFKFNSAIDAARTATAANNFAEARQQIESARVALAIDPGVFPVTELDQMEATIAQVDADLKNAQTAYQNEVARESEIEIQRQMEAAKEEALQQRENAVSDLITQSRQYIAEYNWAAALGVLDQILTLDPNNDYAIGMRQFVEDKAIVQDQHKYRDEFDENYMEQLNLAEEQQIPYNDILRYPTN
ncbi:MAG TPA: hypothetical protein VMD30_00945, partial [Tepidisphaeraceae bacterium]|nr:hypothetical protein [Tepidisphaeraceae bacterium]